MRDRGGRGTRLRLPAALLASAIACLAAPAAASAVTQTFNFTGAAQTFTVPAGVTQVTADAYGAQGGTAQPSVGGSGGRATAAIAVTPGEVLQVNVGGRGADGTNGGDTSTAGWNGGGGVSGCAFFGAAGAGGGASDVRRDANADTAYGLNERLVVAGGGGGATNHTGPHGGTGGGTIGGDGGETASGTGTPGGGGTEGAGGAAGDSDGLDGQPGQLGSGGVATDCSGAGGGGLYGGGSGTRGTNYWSAGGGGSGFTPTGTGLTNGVHPGYGQVLITYRFDTTLTTQASADIVLGGQVTDAATLANGVSPTRQITFNLYGPDDPSCSGTPVFTDTLAVAGNGAYSSTPFTPTRPGTHRWVASYSGDPDNTEATGACDEASERVTVGSAIFEITSVKRNENKGTAKLTVEFSADGSLRIDKTKRVAPTASLFVEGPGTAKLEVEARGEAAKRLERTGRASVTPRALFEAGGEEIGTRRNVKLLLD